MAINIDFLANERDLVRGADNSADALAKVSDALDDVARDSQRSAGKMESEYKDAARGVESSNDRLERSFKDLADAGREPARKIGDDLDAGTKQGTTAASHHVEEFSSEAKANISETFSSFRGDAEDFAQVIQDTLGGLAGGLEGIPAIAAVAAGAAGIGLVLGAIEQGQQQSEAWKQDVADLTAQFIDAGRRGPDAIDAMVDKLKELAANTDDAGVNLSKLDDLTRRSKGSYEDVAQAYAGNTTALRALVRQGDEHIRQLTEQSARTNANDDAQRRAYGGLIDQIQAQSELNDYLEQAAEKADAAAKNQRLYVESGAAGMAAKAQQIRDIDQAYDDAAGAVEDYVDQETGVFDTQKYIDAMTAKAQALDQFKSNMQKAALTLSPDAVQFLQTQGTDAAAQLVAAYLKSTGDQQQQLNSVWSTAGKTSADSYTGSLRSNLPATVPGPKVVIDDVDTSSIPRMIQQTLNGHHFEVPVFATPRVGNAVR